MQYTVKEWMNDLVVFVDAESTVSEALAVMRRRYIHSLIVKQSEHNPEYGILTSTDICDKIVAQERNPNEARVHEIMTSPLIVAHETMSLKECAELMKKKSIHHMPVINQEGKIIGLISDTDFLVAAEAMGRAPGERIV
ncbi:CBS domain-containing protein [Levilinea saccharolytica]|uniref:Predicted signal-transduction protein containing cAMP-binding and CBS domains n=1 Tax=Levilinea saccharolytica TaxID=229921 RepID=A0A0M8JSH9_9CHLR|nr:CBS domain-containing protein [Levilinea saccharolytica]GAP19785.1 predicted signal-transduction protein containing cAMP-binding and CBS domains [Levilinea saccharolytica]GAP19812.1 predicted signal-transduction protein containing cAMP-binding and CBS domains [Levilinea saccharolytica]